MNLKAALKALSVITLILASACAHKSTLSASRTNLSVNAKSFSGKNVAIDLANQADSLSSSMSGSSFTFDNAKNTVHILISTSIKGSAKSVSDGIKGDLVLRPNLKLDIVNDYFSAGCLAKVQIEVVNSKGVIEKTIAKDFKRSFMAGFGGEKRACSEASTEVMALALQSI